MASCRKIFGNSPDHKYVTLQSILLIWRKRFSYSLIFSYKFSIIVMMLTMAQIKKREKSFIFAHFEEH